MLTTLYRFRSLEYFVFLCLLMILAGDIELNPGPLRNICCMDYLSFFHLNVRSIRRKIDYIKNHFLNFDIICFTGITKVLLKLFFCPKVYIYW